MLRQERYEERLLRITLGPDLTEAPLRWQLMTGEHPYLEFLDSVLAEQNLTLGQHSDTLLLQPCEHRTSIFVLPGGLIAGRREGLSILTVSVDDEQEEIRLTASEIDNLA